MRNQPFLEKQPDAREMYYRQVIAQLDQATDMALFLREARRRGYKIQLHIEVDGQFATAGPILMERDKGSEAVEWLAQYVYAIRFGLFAELTEMKALWPDLPEVPVYRPGQEVPPKKTGAPQIEPEGP